jgi:hypothetical protein
MPAGNFCRHLVYIHVSEQYNMSFILENGFSGISTPCTETLLRDSGLGRTVPDKQKAPEGAICSFASTFRVVGDPKKPCRMQVMPYCTYSRQNAYISPFQLSRPQSKRSSILCFSPLCALL